MNKPTLEHMLRDTIAETVAATFHRMPTSEALDYMTRMAMDGEVFTRISPSGERRIISREEAMRAIGRQPV